jgi:hypothetical protein
VDPDSISWLTAAQIRGLMKMMVDPSSFKLLSSSLSLPDDIPVCSSYSEYSRDLNADRVWARSMWIDRWPQDETEAGFLQALADQSALQLILTQVWRPVRQDKAEKRLADRADELRRIKDVQTWFGKEEGMGTLAERESIDSSRRDVNLYHGAVDFKGFVTLLAYERKDLNTAWSTLESMMPAGMHFDMMVGQQWAGWLNALPLGQAGRS